MTPGVREWGVDRNIGTGKRRPPVFAPTTPHLAELRR